MTQPLISIIVPVKNGAKWLRELLDGIKTQTLFDKTEIIFIDSGSTDDTLSIIREYPVELIEIPSRSFNHGLTRNLGVLRSKGEFVLMTVQDAKPANRFWLEQMMEPFKDPEIAAVCGTQVVPHDRDKNPVDWFRPVSSPKMRKIKLPRPAFEKLTPNELAGYCSWDNVNAIYKREILLKYPFEDVVFGEDMLWAKTVLKNEIGLAYNPAAYVFHYHEEKEEYLLRRYFTTWYYRYKHFNQLPDSKNYPFRKRLSAIKILLFATGNMPLSDKWKWFLYNKRRWLVRKDAYNIFNDALKRGEDSLGELHRELCGIPPQHV